MNKNFLDKHKKLLTLVVVTAALIYLGITAFKFMHSQKATSKIQTTLERGKDVVVQHNTDLNKGPIIPPSKKKVI